MFCTVIFIYKNNLITGVFNIFCNYLELLPPAVHNLGCILQTKSRIHPNMETAALVGVRRENGPDPAHSLQNDLFIIEYLKKICIYEEKEKLSYHITTVTVLMF